MVGGSGPRRRCERSGRSGESTFGLIGNPCRGRCPLRPVWTKRDADPVNGPDLGPKRQVRVCSGQAAAGQVPAHRVPAHRAPARPPAGGILHALGHPRQRVGEGLLRELPAVPAGPGVHDARDRVHAGRVAELVRLGGLVLAEVALLPAPAVPGVVAVVAARVRMSLGRRICTVHGSHPDSWEVPGWPPWNPPPGGGLLPVAAECRIRRISPHGVPVQSAPFRAGSGGFSRNIPDIGWRFGGIGRPGRGVARIALWEPVVRAVAALRFCARRSRDESPRCCRSRCRGPAREFSRVVRKPGESDRFPGSFNTPRTRFTVRCGTTE